MQHTLSIKQGSIAYCERGGKGVVLVNCSGDATSVNVKSNTLANGTYVDAITGNTFTVSNGRISGRIGNTGIAVVYQGKLPCQHTWKDATCTAPKTCTKCGETSGTSLGHSWNDATCTAPKTCSVCNTTEGKELDHSYVNGNCGNCGAADPNYKPEDPKFDITLANLTLGNDLTMYFYVPVAPCAELSGSYAEITKPYADGTETAKVTVSLEGLTIITNNGEKLYKVPFTGIAAKEMTDEVTIQIFNAEGKAISNPGKESVRSYLDRFMEANAADAVKMRLAIDMLNYGAAAQTHFGYNTENLANADLTAEQLAYGTVIAPVCKNGNVKGVNAKGSNLTLESSILMNFYFNGLTEDMYAIVTFTDHTGASHNEKLGAHDGSRFTVNQVVVADARKLVTVTVYNADGSVYGTCIDSVESYVARARAAGVNDLAVYEAIIKFADSAYIYLHNR